MGNAGSEPARNSSAGCGSGVFSEGIFDVYEIGEMLGSGTFAQVRRCWPLEKADREDEYAVKIVDTMSEVFRQASNLLSPRQEANILRGLRHPHVIDLVDVFQKDRWLFLVLETMQGGELFSALANPNAVVTDGCVANVGRQLLLALEYLHDQDVVHRDVKAENILLVSNPAETGKWHVKLVDFGLAMRMEQPACMFDFCRSQELPLEELICGTAYYCAPEVWVNDYTPKVDVFAAGVVLYLALHGTFPFYDSDAGRLEALICDLGKAPPFRAVCRSECPDYEISAPARELLTSLLTKEQDDRPCATEALRLPWIVPAKAGALVACGAIVGCSRLAGSRKSSTLLGGRDGSKGTAGQGAVDTSGAAREVPLPIRAKAGRAAQRPLVDPNKEQSRTKALEAMQRRASIPGRSQSLASACDLERILRSPSGLRRGRELGHEPLSNRGHSARLTLSDSQSSEGNSTDSEVEDNFLSVCACR